MDEQHILQSLLQQIIFLQPNIESIVQNYYQNGMVPNN